MGKKNTGKQTVNANTAVEAHPDVVMAEAGRIAEVLTMPHDNVVAIDTRKPEAEKKPRATTAHGHALIAEIMVAHRRKEDETAAVMAALDTFPAEVRLGALTRAMKLADPGASKVLAPLLSAAREANKAMRKVLYKTPADAFGADGKETGAKLWARADKTGEKVWIVVDLPTDLFGEDARFVVTAFRPATDKRGAEIVLRHDGTGDDDTDVE